MERLARVVVVGVCAVLAGAAFMAGGNSSEAAPEDDVRAAADRVVNAWNDGDAEEFIAGFTEEGLLAEFDFSSIEEAEEVLPEFIGDPPLEIVSFNVIAISDFNATADMELAFGQLIERSHQDFRFVDGEWLVHTSRPIRADVPAGTTTVPLSLVEYAFVYDEGLITDGDIAFAVTNAGMQDHEVILAKLNTSAPLEELIMSEEEPEGVETVFVYAPSEPGDSNTLVLTDPLSNGRYALLCFFPAPDGTPHAFLGMTSEFTIGAGPAPSPGGPGISPPSTGDGGLVSGDRDLIGLGAAIAVTLLFASFAAVRAHGAEARTK